MDSPLVGGVTAHRTIPLFFFNSKILAVGDLGRETQGKGPIEEGKWPQRPNISHVPRKYPLVTPKSEARSEISVTFGIYEGKVDFLCPLFNSPIHI